MIRELFVSGKSVKSAARKLSALGYKTARGKKLTHDAIYKFARANGVRTPKQAKTENSNNTSTKTNTITLKQQVRKAIFLYGLKTMLLEGNVNDI